MLSLLVALSLTSTLELSVAAGGGVASDTVGLGPQLAARVQFAEAAEERLVVSWWGRFLIIDGPNWGHDHQLSFRAELGRYMLGLEAEFRNLAYRADGEWVRGSGDPFMHQLGVGPAIGVVILEREALRLDARLAWMPLAVMIGGSPNDARDLTDPLRFSVLVELAWKLLVVRALGGLGQGGMMRHLDAYPPLYPHLGLYVGLRWSW